MEYRGKNVLVTGASSGIGASFARALAARGANLILVARNERRLKQLADELAPRGGTRAEVVVADLAVPHAAVDVVAATKRLDMPVDVLVNNAGFAVYGPIASADPARLTEQVQVNCVAPVELAALLVPAMARRGSGAVVNVASTAAYQPLPYMAVYGASKAFVLSFSEALWAEQREHGVRVVALCPGATDTAFFDVVGAAEAQVGSRMSADAVVAATLRALDRPARRGGPTLITGGRNAAVAKLPRLLTRRATALVAQRTMRPQASR